MLTMSFALGADADQISKLGAHISTVTWRLGQRAAFSGRISANRRIRWRFVCRFARLVPNRSSKSRCGPGY
jgi:hypothetical protein